ncbi:flagellar filament capping protein FliD [Rugamonas rubra]|uniref:Flagellar hook-associated protein 2 n=1 Tax=Rugamonas rubra TaxID=758825 RepID=A0A1I4NQK9_9BURK|nr:flagellar filament capping protein FliD [Rugamonas rubra]SFM17818.1 flagellar hook-associated protein 2 [Rugamonas rubra]
MVTTSALSAGNYGSTAATSDVYARVERTMASQNSGVAKLNTTLTRDQAKLSGLGQLQSALASFKNIAAGLAGNGLSTSASSSTKGVLTASASGSAKAASYAVDVKQLAQGQLLTSDMLVNSAGKIGTGAPATVKIEFGNADEKSFTPVGAGKSITIDSKNNTLDGIAAAFREAGVDAKVVKSGNGFALSIAGQSGAEHSMRISVSGDAAVKDLLAYNPAGSKNMKEGAAAQDALLTVNGKEVKSASNTLDKAIDGVSLTLAAKGKTDVVIAQDPAQIGKNVRAFVTAYNELNDKLQALQKGELKSDRALSQASGQLSQLLKTGGNGVSVAALANAGVSLEANGSLKLDEKKLTSALAADAGTVGKLFSNDGKGIADQLASKITALTGNDSTIRKEALSIGKEITSLNGKKAQMTKALTAQANALVALYTQQAQTGAAGGSGKPTSLFDMLA